MKVEQYKHANQFHIYQYTDTLHINILQSYNSTVVKIETKINKDLLQFKTTIILGFDWDYSLTTARHVYDFLEEYGNINFDGITNKKEYVNKLIEDGTIKYDWGME